MHNWNRKLDTFLDAICLFNTFQLKSIRYKLIALIISENEKANDKNYR